MDWAKWLLSCSARTRISDVDLSVGWSGINNDKVWLKLGELTVTLVDAGERHTLALGMDVGELAFKLAQTDDSAVRKVCTAPITTSKEFVLWQHGVHNGQDVTTKLQAKEEIGAAVSYNTTLSSRWHKARHDAEVAWGANVEVSGHVGTRLERWVGRSSSRKVLVHYVQLSVKTEVCLKRQRPPEGGGGAVAKFVLGAMSALADGRLLSWSKS